MKAVIPAAGMGKRLLPHTLALPKVMLNVAGKPILAHIVEDLIRVGFTEISIIVGYRKDVIIEYFQDRYPVKFNFPVQTEMLGLGHAVRYGLEDSRSPVLILLGDTIFRTDLARFRNLDVNTLGVAEVTDPRRFGIVSTDSEQHITDLVEKPENPPSNLAIAGLYYIREQGQLLRAIDRLIREDRRTRDEFQLTDALKIMIDSGDVFQAEHIDGWYDCGKKETLISTSGALLGDQNTILGRSEDCVLIPPVHIGKNASVKRCILGPNVTVSEDSIVEDSIAQSCIFNTGSQIFNSVLRDSIIGSGAVVQGKHSILNLSDFGEFSF